MMRIGTLQLWWNGMRDGRKGIPAQNSLALSPFEQKLVMIANRQIREHEEALRNHVEPLSAGVNRDADELSRNDVPEFERLVELAGDRRHPEQVVGGGVYALLLAVLTLGELAFNAQAFSVFGEGTAMNIVMALAVGVSLPLIAHLFGADLRQASWTRGRAMGWFASLAVTALALMGINYMRVRFLQTVLVDALDTHNIVESGLEASAAYYVLNLLVFVCATAVSYFHADPIRGFIQAHRRVEARRRRVSDMRGRLARARATAEAQAAQTCENTMALIHYYRMINSRHRRSAAPQYFVDPSHPAHRPTFATLRLGAEVPEESQPTY